MTADGTPILLADGFAAEGPFRRGAGGGAAAGRGRLPFILLTGSVKEHHATGVRTRRSAGSTKLVPEARLEINPADAATLGVAEGDMVRVSAAGGGARRSRGGGHRPRAGGRACSCPASRPRPRCRGC